jgi:hypothetical protein
MSNVPLNVMMTVYRKDLLAFARKSFSILNPGGPFLDNWHIEAICYRLQRVISGRCNRLIINLPPRCLKSHLSSIALPAYMLGQNPAKKIVYVSYSQNLSEKHSSDNRRLVESPWYRGVFPAVRLVRSAAAEIETDHGGYRLATSTEGTLTVTRSSSMIHSTPTMAIQIPPEKP